MLRRFVRENPYQSKITEHTGYPVKGKEDLSDTLEYRYVAVNRSVRSKCLQIFDQIPAVPLKHFSGAKFKSGVPSQHSLIIGCVRY